MLNQTELKTLIPSLVASGILVYEAITGNSVSEHVSNELTNGILIGAGYMITLYGIWKNHQKNKPPEVKNPPIQGVNTIEEIQSVQPVTPVVTQEDINKRLGS